MKSQRVPGRQDPAPTGGDRAIAAADQMERRTRTGRLSYYKMELRRDGAGGGALKPPVLSNALIAAIHAKAGVRQAWRQAPAVDEKQNVRPVLLPATPIAAKD